MRHMGRNDMKNRNDNRIGPMTLLAVLLLAAAAAAAACIPWRLARLIDVGVRCGGVEYATPLRIRASTMDDLRLFLPEDTARDAKRAYDLVGGVYVLHGSGEAKRMSERFTEPVLEYLRISQRGVNTFAAIRAGLDNGSISADEVRGQAEAAVKAMGALTPAARTEAATSFVRTEYAVSGGNPDTLRQSVITAELWRMTGLALAALFAAGVGLLLLEREDANDRRALLPAAIAAFSAVSAVVMQPLTGLIVLAEAAVLIFALWRLRPRERRAVSLAAGILACAAVLCAAAPGVHALTITPGKLIALLSCAMLAAVSGLCVRNGKEARA